MAKDQLEQFKECGVERQIIFDIGSDDEVVMFSKGILLIPNSSQLEICIKALISSAVDLEQIRNVSHKLQILKIHNICSLTSPYLQSRAHIALQDCQFAQESSASAGPTNGLWTRM